MSLLLYNSDYRLAVDVASRLSENWKRGCYHVFSNCNVCPLVCSVLFFFSFSFLALKTAVRNGVHLKYTQSHKHFSDSTASSSNPFHDDGVLFVLPAGVQFLPHEDFFFSSSFFRKHLHVLGCTHCLYAFCCFRCTQKSLLSTRAVERDFCTELKS